jgi:DNA polymerase-4
VAILHADMDAFYASIEQRDHPELRGKPVIVGGLSARGVVSAASYEARAFGVHSAMPGYEARRRCPQGVFLRGDMARYQRESKRIFAVFQRFTPRVEGISLDEAFLDLAGTERLHGPPLEVGRRLRAAVREETGLAVSVGIAPVKMVAKIASDQAKPDGLLEVRAAEVRAFLAPLPVRRIWGVGPVAGQRLERAGFRTLDDLARAPEARLRASLGAWGLEAARLARGEDLREVEPWREAVSLGEESTFDVDVREPDRLVAAVVTHGEAVARRLRRSGLAARTIVLKLKLARRTGPGPRGFPLLTRRATLAEATDDGAAISAAARALLARWGIPEPVRLVGVAATNLVPADAAQLPLFGPPRPGARRARLNRALDEIARRFGRGALVRGIEEPLERAGLTLQFKRGEEDPDTGA